ncbi:hypothetical protein CHS0354_036957 [Potamilus streckersoni]|uniref:Uncharacterized protein n=1 Tax=Potamilus streckersoni TaxID=2493646 RepID=A0AAE0TBT9_9BIVA|nr:hypothetical protein CHS0354_036957 [Potamilus streckersoni]
MELKQTHQTFVSQIRHLNKIILSCFSLFGRQGRIAYRCRQVLFSLVIYSLQTSGTSNPVQPINPVKSSNPVQSSNSVQSSNPVKSSNYVKSSNPVKSSNSVQSSNPVKSSNYVKSSNPVKSSNSVQSSNPVKSMITIADYCDNGFNFVLESKNS